MRAPRFLVAFAAKTPAWNGDNWLLTRDFAFIDLCFSVYLARNRVALRLCYEATAESRRNVSDRVLRVRCGELTRPAVIHSYCPGLAHGL